MNHPEKSLLIQRNWLRIGTVWLLGAGIFMLAIDRLLQAEQGSDERMFCLSFALAIVVLIATASGRAGFALAITGGIAMVLHLASDAKLTYLREPLLAPDLRYLVTASTIRVIVHYHHLRRLIVAGIAASLLLAIIIWWLESPGIWRGRSPLVRGIAVVLAVLPAALILWPQGPFQQVHAITEWGLMSAADRNPTSAFLRSLTRMHIRMPDYTPEAATALDWGASSTTPPARRPDLVAVLEESTLDPRQWAICNVPRCTFDLFTPDANTRAYGKLRVHTYGGATWTTEFAFFTGLPHTLFGPAGIYAPYNLAPHMHETLPRYLKTLGYQTIAIYPMPRTFVNAAGAYKNYGFDEFHDAQEMGLVWESTDHDLMRHVEDLLRTHEHDAQPLFVMILTMRQHGPHDYALDALPAPWNTPPFPRMDARINRNLGTYLFRLSQSSEAMDELLRYVFAHVRPTVLTHFGDHHPSFDGLESKLQNALPNELQEGARQLTYYRIDANTGHSIKLSGPLDIAFLGGLLLDVAELPRDAYFEANARLRDRCAGRFDNCPDHAAMDSYLAYIFDRLQVFAR